MSYEQKARTAAANLKATHLRPCGDCNGFEEHEPNCPTLRPALLEKAPKPGAAELGEPLTLEQVKALHVARVLREKGWRKAASARALGIDRRTLHQMIERYGIKPP